MSNLEWKYCKKKPIVVKFRPLREATEVIETDEGILLAHKDLDFIMSGINGEVYPIKKEIFWKTYDVIDDE